MKCNALGKNDSYKSYGVTSLQLDWSADSLVRASGADEARSRLSKMRDLRRFSATIPASGSLPPMPMLFAMSPCIHDQKYEKHNSEHQQHDRPGFFLPQVTQIPKIHLFNLLQKT